MLIIYAYLCSFFVLLPLGYFFVIVIVMDVSGQNRKVLIIDDNEDIRTIYSTSFEQAGYKVLTTNDGLAGITEIAEFNPTVIILDLLMPEMDGYEFISNLRNNTSIKAPIIVTSSFPDEDKKKDAIERGADLYLVKSDYSGEELVGVVDRFLLNWRIKPNDETN